MKLEEQNRNQLTFGAGVSQFEGFFGQLSFQTANFLGRGESLTVSLQGGSRAQNYTVAFTEPFLFDRNITGGVNLFRSDVRYVGQFTQKSTGGALTFGFPLGRGFTRMFTNYSYERVRVTEISTASTTDPLVLRAQPVPARLAADRRRAASASSARSCRASCYNTVDQPIFPTTGRRLTLSIDLAGLGGNTNFIKPTVEGGLRSGSRTTGMSLGMRGADRIHPPARQHSRRCRSSRSCSSAASTASAASTCGRSAARIWSPASCSAATRACCSTSSRSSRLPARCG